MCTFIQYNYRAHRIIPITVLCKNPLRPIQATDALHRWFPCIYKSALTEESKQGDRRREIACLAGAMPCRGHRGQGRFRPLQDIFQTGVYCSYCPCQLLSLGICVLRCVKRGRRRWSDDTKRRGGREWWAEMLSGCVSHSRRLFFFLPPLSICWLGALLPGGVHEASLVREFHRYNYMTRVATKTMLEITSGSCSSLWADLMLSFFKPKNHLSISSAGLSGSSDGKRMGEMPSL